MSKLRVLEPITNIQQNKDYLCLVVPYGNVALSLGQGWTRLADDFVMREIFVVEQLRGLPYTKLLISADFLPLKIFLCIVSLTSHFVIILLFVSVLLGALGTCYQIRPLALG